MIFGVAEQGLLICESSCPNKDQVLRAKSVLDTGNGCRSCPAPVHIYLDLCVPLLNVYVTYI